MHRIIMVALVAGGLGCEVKAPAPTWRWVPAHTAQQALSSGDSLSWKVEKTYDSTDWRIDELERSCPELVVTDPEGKKAIAVKETEQGLIEAHLKADSTFDLVTPAKVSLDVQEEAQDCGGRRCDVVRLSGSGASMVPDVTAEKAALKQLREGGCP